jgi:eukaryotic-like serine/threonine-protein kinase
MPTQPSQIGKYKILALIGKGGMGAVYKAQHPTLKKTVIIKKLTLTGSKDFVERFRREAQLMMEFRNEKIVQVYDHFKEGNSYHIVMEYVDGITLEELIQSKRFLSEEAALLIFSETCKALKYAHDRQVIHRDIKPANILISNAGVVKLVDFGVSASLESSEDDGLTKAGMTIGTPSYLAPEQIANARNRDKRTDIYSLGVMLYEMILGKKPFRGGFTPEVIAQIEKGKYVTPRKINPKIKGSTQRIVKKAMHHKVQKRYQDLEIVLKKTAHFLKPFKTQEDIYTAIRLYLEGKDTLTRPKKSWIPDLSGKAAIFGFCAGALILVASAGTFWGMQQQIHHEWLDDHELGALEVLIKVKKGRKTADETYINSRIYTEGRQGSLKEDKTVQFNFKEIKELESNSHFTFKSEKLYLPQKMYMLLLYVENEQFRENFYLAPRIRQREVLNSIDARQITINTKADSPQLPAKVSFKVFSIHSHKDITRKTEMAVRVDNVWKEWTRFVSGLRSSGFYSGNRYKLRFKHPDYQVKTYNLTIQPEQTRIELKINLIPIPGTLFVKSEVEDIHLLIDDSEYVFDDSRERLYKKLDPLTTSHQKLTLSPGEYRLTAESSKLIFGSSSIDHKISLQPKEKIYLTISKTPDNESLRFNFQ